MARKNQASVRIKTQLLQRGMTVTALAERIGKTRESTSRAINQNRNPRVRALIKEVLNG